MRPVRYSINVTLDGCCDHRVIPAERPDWIEPFARTIEGAKKYFFSSTLDRVDWNADLLRGGLATAVRQLKQETSRQARWRCGMSREGNVRHRGTHCPSVVHQGRAGTSAVIEPRFRMCNAKPIAWRTAAHAFERILREHGAQPDAVTDVEVAWDAFAEFLQTGLAGVAPAGEDGDGFIVQWGRRSWAGNRLHLALTRQLAVLEDGDAEGSDWQTELWHVELQLAFDDEPALIALEPALAAVDTGFRFDPIGPPRAAALAEGRTQALRQALVRALWTATPVSSALTFARAW
ncbi:hypothetical protein [Amycolatopsis sp. NPDC051903]|uniref:hypothetical protein n=1 Tax=Amycolatopsis sp. NPDC051903 TaxID=3363936 RepID=UPI0037AD72F7